MICDFINYSGVDLYSHQNSQLASDDGFYMLLWFYGSIAFGNETLKHHYTYNRWFSKSTTSAYTGFPIFFTIVIGLRLTLWAEQPHAPEDSPGTWKNSSWTGSVLRWCMDKDSWDMLINDDHVGHWERRFAHSEAGNHPKCITGTAPV